MVGRVGFEPMTLRGLILFGVRPSSYQLRPLGLVERCGLNATSLHGSNHAELPALLIEG